MAAFPITAHSHRVRDLNDAFRRSFSGGRVVLKAGVAALHQGSRTALLAAVPGYAQGLQLGVGDARYRLVPEKASSGAARKVV